MSGENEEKGFIDIRINCIKIKEESSWGSYETSEYYEPFSITVINTNIQKEDLAGLGEIFSQTDSGEELLLRIPELFDGEKEIK